LFPIEGILESVSDHQFQFNVNSYDQSNLYFHSEKDEESNSGFYMHYENGFVSPNPLMRRSNVCGETKVSQSFSLRQRGISQNQVFDRGRKL